MARIKKTSPPKLPRPPKPPNHHITGSDGAAVPVAAKLSCQGCGWAQLVLLDDDEPLVERCPECGREVEQQVIRAPLRCPHCHLNTSVLSITSMGRAQICARCAGDGFSVPMRAAVS